ncbi:MAG: SLC5/6 family protein [Planctomycetota bacterium]
MADRSASVADAAYPCSVPLPWLMLLILAVRGLTLDGSMQGLAYYLDPVWSELAKPVTWRYAVGQVFFSLSLAYGIMITYSSFLHRKSDLNNNAAIISIADFATSFVAGLAVFATLGGMAFVTQQAGNAVTVGTVAESGPSLAFVAFPYALAQLPYSAWFSFIFFFALVTLGLDSAFSMTESILASIVDKTGWRRSIILPLLTVVGFTLGLLFVTKAGFNWLGTIDGFVNGTWGIAFMGLLECIVIGWLWRVGKLRRHANSRSDWQLGRWWDYLIRLVIPILLGTLFFWQLFDDISGGYLFRIKSEYQVVLDKGMIPEELRKDSEDKSGVFSQQATFSVEQEGVSWLIIDEDKEYLIRKEEGRLNIYDSKGGLLRTPGGEWKLPNCVGLLIVALVPVFAVILSLVRGRRDVEQQSHEEVDFGIRGSRGGVLVFLLALIPAAGLLVILLGSAKIPEAAQSELVNPVFWLLMVVGIVAMGLSNHLVDKHNTSSSQVSWFARWAGILATMDVSAFVAVILLGLKGGVKISEETMPIRDKLSGVSYIILAVVFLIIIGGLAWCFYRALLAANAGKGIQHPDEVGDEIQVAEDKNSV